MKNVHDNSKISFFHKRALKAAIVDMHQSLPRPYAEPTEDCELMNQRSRELAKLLGKTR